MKMDYNQPMDLPQDHSVCDGAEQNDRSRSAMLAQVEPDGEDSLLPPALWQSPPPGYAPETGTPCLLALSGGADSRLLLHCLAPLCQKGGTRLHLAHVNHGIRGAEADRDEQFCRRLAEHYQLPLHILHADVPAIAAREGESLEAAARKVRYSYFSQLMREYNLSLLVTAHHADDQTETILFRLIRGSGLRGLCGIAPWRPFDSVPGAMIWRPLLPCSRENILSFCRKFELTYVTDSTNDDPAYPRNRLRAEVVPVLRNITKHPEKQILRTCASLREDEDFLTSLAEAFLAKHAAQTMRKAESPLSCQPYHPDLPEDSASCTSIVPSLDATALSQAPIPVAKRALLLWGARSGICRMWETVHLNQLLALCRLSSGEERYLSLPGGKTACLSCGRLFLLDRGMKNPQESQVSANADWTLPLRIGIFTVPGGRYRICVREISDHFPSDSLNHKNVYNPFTRDTLTFDTISPCYSDVYFWRTRREGDIFLRNGMHRKLRKLQNQTAFPAYLRDKVPLLCDQEGVVWHPFLGLRDGFPCAPGDNADGFPHTILHLALTVEAVN